MKFLYNDGSGKVREVASKEELDYHLGISPDKSKVRVWLYHSSKWITYEDYLKSASGFKTIKEEPPTQIETPKPVKTAPVVSPFVPSPPPSAHKEKRVRPQTVTKPLQFILNICIVLVVAGGVYAALFYNTKEWTEPNSFEVTAARPANSPPVHADSLIQTLEVKEMRTLDKLTKMNLRLRTNWPEKIVCSLQGAQEKHLKKDSIKRFRNLELIVKNFTGYELDDMVVAVEVWKKDEVVKTDTFHITSIGFREPHTQNITNSYKGDSLTVHIGSIRSFGLNFCYSYDKPTISGNPNDKWFCKD